MKIKKKPKTTKEIPLFINPTIKIYIHLINYNSNNLVFKVILDRNQQQNLN